MIIPPHLPPKSSSIALHYRLRSLPWMLFVIAVAVISSAATAITAAVWVSTSLLTHDNFLSFIHDNASSNTTAPDSVLVGQTTQRMMKVYDKKKRVDGAYYSRDGLVSSAVILSVDGWTVMPRENYKTGEEKDWEGVDVRGVGYPVTAAVYDSVAHLLYTRFGGSGFRIMPIAEWDTILSQPNGLYAVTDHGWQAVTMDQIQIGATAHAIWQPTAGYRIQPTMSDGTLLVNSAGNFAGFVDRDGGLILPWLVSNQLGHVLENGSIAYRGIAWDGYMVDGTLATDTVKIVSGFYVTKSPTRATSSTVGRGDVVTEINGRAIDAAEIARTILFAPDAFNVTVMRKQTELRIDVRKVLVGE